MYHDLCEVFNDLTDEQAGKIIKEIINTSLAITHDIPQEPTGLSGLLKAVFNPFKAHITRDYEKWECIAERNKTNGKKGGRPKEITQANPEEPVKGNVSGKVNDTVNDNDIIIGAITPKTPPKKKVSSRGKRWNPDDYEESELTAWGEDAMSKYNWDSKKVLDVYERFNNYWKAKAGANATKVDWKATWSNWCANAIDYEKA